MVVICHLSFVRCLPFCLGGARQQRGSQLSIEKRRENRAGKMASFAKLRESAVEAGCDPGDRRGQTEGRKGIKAAMNRR